MTDSIPSSLRIAVPAAPRVAIAGAGLMGRWHAVTAVRVGGRVVAVVDPRLDTARALAARHAAPVFADLRQMLAATPVDVLHVCTPAESHFESARIAIEAGIHVVVEKPFAETADRTIALCDLACDAGVLLCPVHQFPFQDGVLAARRRLGEIGSLVHAEVVVCSAGGDGRDSERLDELVADIIPHPASLFKQFLPGESLDRAWSVVRPRAGELRATTEASGATASIRISLHARPPACTLSLEGTRATIHADLFHGFSFLEPGTVSRARKVARPFARAARETRAAAANLARRLLAREAAYPGLARLFAEFYDAVAGGGPSPISAAQVVEIARVRDRLCGVAPVPSTARRE